MKADFEDAVDVQAANERLAKMGLGSVHYSAEAKAAGWKDSPPSCEDIADSMAVAAPLGSKPRAPRSDKGLPRPKPEAPAPAQSRPLTEQQWARVNVYFDRVSQSAADLARAERSHTALLAEAHSYLDSLKGGA